MSSEVFRLEQELKAAKDALRRIANIAEQERKRVGSGWWQQVWEIAKKGAE